MTNTFKQGFETAVDAIDPSIVPSVTLSNGDKMPVLGMGTFGSDTYSAEEIATAVQGAAAFGQRAFDCASVHSNEKEIGGSFKRIMERGVPREELFITSMCVTTCTALPASLCSRARPGSWIAQDSTACRPPARHVFFR
ncbi:MAG: aldo/keto reductase [Pontiellaceae bacterium]|nr:aldo/keto reductase [Pontiellaceae bacterium]MBN2786316.1 aldo/keto reductase [Pontiellaceae bacterium]